MQYQPKHRSQTHRTVFDARLGRMIAKTDRITDAQRMEVCLGTHCKGISAPWLHRNNRVPIHKVPR